MPKILRKRRNIAGINLPQSPHEKKSGEDDTPMNIEKYAKSILQALGQDSLPQIPSNFSLYFDRLLENQSSIFKKQIASILELEDGNNDANIIELEKNLKIGFTSVKNILLVSADLYKNISIMNKILKKKKNELAQNKDVNSSVAIIDSLEYDINKLNSIFTKQITSLKSLYDETAKIVKNVENETIFDNQYGIYNKRYLFMKLEQEIDLINKFKHQSSVITIELAHSLVKNTKSKQAIVLMTKTIARLLLKTSRRSDIVSHYGNGVFIMLLKYTNIDNAIKASERLVDLVNNTNFFISDKEINLAVNIGIMPVLSNLSSEEIVASALQAMDKAYESTNLSYAVASQER